MSKRISVMWLGLRGFPSVQGGVETHAEQICTSLATMGCDVEVVVRKGYQPDHVGAVWKGVRFAKIWAPKSKTFEAIVHTFFGVIYAAVRRPDVLHIQAIGPALLTPLARLLRLKVVVTHHGPDYDRQKWGRAAKYALRLGERMGMMFANERIVISRHIGAIVSAKYAKKAVLIPNGVSLPVIPDTAEALARHGLESKKYILLVSRIVPEKRHHDLIDAFTRAVVPGWKLVIVGAADHPDTYTQSVIERARAHQDIVCTGYQSGVALQELYTHAAVFVLPSSHEGLPIALLEALSYGLPVIASDIAANTEVDAQGISYFPLGNVEHLAALLTALYDEGVASYCPDMLRAAVHADYNWTDIADKTVGVYHQICGVNARLLSKGIPAHTNSRQAEAPDNRANTKTVALPEDDSISNSQASSPDRERDMT